MSLKVTWLGREAVDRIGELRARCYGTGPADREAFIAKTVDDVFDDGDVLVLSDDTGDVATATSRSFKMNVRGTEVACQGVAWVGTVRSHRRRRVDGRGLASRVMDAVVAKGRERGQAVSMLAPFRVSFYENFGFGVFERQNTWQIPLDLLPQEDTSGFAEYRPEDFVDSVDNRRRQFQRTHGDVVTDAERMKFWLKSLSAFGYRMVERQGDKITGQFTLGTEMENGLRVAVVYRPAYDGPDALRRMLAMLGTLRDQYSSVRITLPTDVPINWWLRERQIPHRPVDHPAAKCTTFTRMQLAIYDVPSTVAALKPQPGYGGVINVGVGGSTWRIEVADGHASASEAQGEADLVIDPHAWPAVLMGDLPVDTAVFVGKISVRRPQSLPLLSALVAGPTPYCHEYF